MQKFLGVDIETTGLYPTSGQILELACVPLDENLEVCGDIFQGTFTFQGDFGSLSDFIKKMHGAEGTNLLHTPGYSTLSKAEEYLTKYSGADVHILGSSVSFDRDWLKVHFPSIKFHYRIMDTSSLKLLYPIKVSETDSEHRALADIEYSIRLAKAYRKLIIRGLD
jgi:oligoribonuclease (3'-5' exoribonuclease)